MYAKNVKYDSILMNNVFIRKIINDSKINENDNWKEIFGTELSEKFINTFENIIIFSLIHNFLMKKKIWLQQQQNMNY